MTIIQVKTADQVLSAVLVPKLAPHNQNSVKLKVDFDSAWDGYGKSAVFYTKNNPIPYERALDANNTCFVPAVVLAEPGYLFITIKGVKLTDDSVKASARLKLKIAEGMPLFVVSEPTEDVYSQLLAALSAVNNAIAVERARLNTAMNAVTTDTEVTDIRVGADGRIYDTAGEAVREQLLRIMSNYFRYYGMATTDENGIADLNDMPANTAYLISLYQDDTDEIANMPDGKRHGTVLTFGNPDGTGRLQIFSADSGTNFYIRQSWGNNRIWKEWNKLAFKSDIDALKDTLTPADAPLATIKETAGLLNCFLNVGCIGDSLASGESVYKDDNGSIGYVDIYKHSWGQYLARMTGNKYYNWSSGGRTTASWLSSSYATECFDGQHKCEAYIIGLGQNDRNQNVTIGTLSDIDTSNYENNANTYYGNYGKIIQKVKEVQPKAKIFVLTDPLSVMETSGYNGAIRTIATMFDNVYLVDLYTYGKELFTTGIIAESNRSGHYNAMAYREIALIIANFIDWIMRHNVTEFDQIEFIGTEYSY